RYVAGLDPEEDPEEYEDDESEDGSVNYPMNGGDNGDDDDGDSSWDDADDKDEDEEEEEEHLAMSDSVVVVPATVMSSASSAVTYTSIYIDSEPRRSLPPVVSPTAESPEYVAESDPEEDPEEYEDDETKDGPVDYPMEGGDDGDADDSDSSGDDDEDKDDEDEEEEEEEEHLAPADSAVVIPTDELVSPPKGTTPTEMPPRKRLCFSTLGSRYEVRESSTARDTWVDPTETVPEIAHMTVAEVNTRVTELAELHEHDTQDL
nr:hypothetical protein [Tanacetum cinerariifolium]